MKFRRKGYKAFLDIVDGDDSRTTQALYRLFVTAVAAVLLVFLVNLLSIGKSSFGEWGDFFGGVLNPILTFLTFMGLLITIVIQQAELKESRKEFKRSADALDDQSKSLKKQNFESTFFQMLSLHNDIVNSIDLVEKESGNTTKGRDCFRVFYTRLARLYRETKNKGKGKYPPESIAELSYTLFWKDHQTELGHYFRYLYNLIKFVDESEFSEGPYIKLVRAQLSDQELFLLFYNSTSNQGHKFRTYIERYALFDNMPTVRILDNRHLKLYSESAYGESS
ncbi:putative phage abortive infection protein [Pseudomonas carassii]|uniref:Phage abortive infection protein n=1 Tax=Pseudomonas carassii TaxID=3115855 RepID=A0ABU7HA68_9PSED|nr:putative phage abortive infection protein [Pseudomonas sp. 137P]MEE1888208.1 putative phage abortive infection protein [Pseudomonas sp. 137P]